MDIFTFFPSWLLLIVPIIFFSSIFLTNTLPWKKSSNNPPSPPRLPIIGNLHQLIGKSFHQTLWRISQKYGPIMLLHLGSQPYLIITSSEMANEALKTHDHILSSRPRSKGFKKLTFNYMDLTFSPSGDHWKKMRKLLITEFFSPKRSRLFKIVTENEVKGLISSLSLNKEVNFDDMLTSLVTDISCKVIVGKSYRKGKFRGKSLKEILNELVVLLAGSFSDIFPTIGGILDELSGWNSRLDKCFRDLDGFLEMVLDEHVDYTASETRQHEDLIDACSSQLTRDEMKGLLMNSINGSIDTTTMTMLWTMSEIVKNPRVMKKLQDEIRSCVGKKSSVEESDLTQMKYLKLVVKETLRLRSPAPWLLIRECESYCQIGGYDIFPGTRILINSWGIGKDPKVWGENANEFIPERLEKFKVEHCEMIPFGGGRRACPAANLATSIVELTIANLLYSFDWKTPSGVKNEDIDMEEVGTLVVKRNTPLCLVPLKHNWVD